MNPAELNTKAQNTWCPGCPNFGILQAFKEAAADLVAEGKTAKKDLVTVTGIGCHAKIFDYLDLNGFYGIHGRVLPVAFGIKTANPKLTVVGFGGDGDTFAEGMGHFIHSCNEDADFTIMVHNNQVFSLTTGQPTPTTEKGFVGAASPLGKREEPINPLFLALAAGAGFVARGFALDIPHLKDLIKKAIAHKGFSFLEILQPCIVYHNVVPYFQKNVYKIDQSHNQADLSLAIKKSLEWDYSFAKDQKVPIGIFFQKPKPSQS